MNELYENNYSKYIEPVYGEKRNKQTDKQLLIQQEKLYNSYFIPTNDRYNFSDYEVYSIDPDGCKDADDAFSIYEESEKLYLIIHIADPTQYISLNSDLWNDIIQKTTTKYLSNREPIHLMPNEILELSSLMTSNDYEYKNTISIITEIDKDKFIPINSIQLVFGIVKINKNNSFTYKEASLLGEENIVLKNGLAISNSLFNIRKEKTKGTKLSDLSNAYIKYEDNNVYLYEDSVKEKEMKHMIAEFAIFANSFVGEYLKINLNTGIFRTCNANQWLQDVYDNISGEEMLQEIITNGIRAEYLSTIESHDLVGMPEYCHFTSPIRRLSDCVCHYLLKDIYFKNRNVINKIPFNQDDLNKLAIKCVNANKKDKKNQYLDIKFRLLQVMANLINYNEKITIQYYITGYSGLFLNLIICKIDNFNVHMSYTLRIRNYNKTINPKEKFELIITQVNCFIKFDENTIPELDQVFLY